MLNHQKKIITICVLLVTIVSVSIVHGEETIEQKKFQFLEKFFLGPPPDPAYLWITPAIRSRIKAILLRDYNGLCIPYWEYNEETLWILNDTPKEKPVYVEIVIYQEKIKYLDIIFSSGKWGKQVQSKYFKHQFKEIALDENELLNKKIDSISGATFSVNTVSRLAQLALFLNKMKSKTTK